MKEGATAVYACCTHPVLSGNAVAIIKNSPLKKLVVTNTIPLKDEAKAIGKIDVLDVSPILGEAIRRIHSDESVSFTIYLRSKEGSMDQMFIQAETRKDKGKSTARKLRKRGKDPGHPLRQRCGAPSYYGFSEGVERPRQAREEKCHTGYGAYGRRDAEHRPVMIKEVQREVVGEQVLHIDFLQVSMTRMIEVEIPIHLIGESKGVLKEGIVEQHLRSIRVECLPTQIPEVLEIDVTDLDIGDSFHVSQISMPGVKLLEGSDVAIVTIAHGGAEETPAAAEVEAEAEKKEE